MKTLAIAASLVLVTPALASSPDARSTAKAMAEAGASSESIALGLVHNRLVGSVSAAYDIANEVTQSATGGSASAVSGDASATGGSASSGGNTQTVEGTDIPQITAGFHFRAPDLYGNAPDIVPGSPEVALNRGVSTLLGAVQWDELTTTHSGALAWMAQAWGDDPLLAQAYLCNEVEGIKSAVEAAGYSCPGDK